MDAAQYERRARNCAGRQPQLGLGPNGACGCSSRGAKGQWACRRRPSNLPPCLDVPRADVSRAGAWGAHRHRPVCELPVQPIQLG